MDRISMAEILANNTELHISRFYLLSVFPEERSSEPFVFSDFDILFSIDRKRSRVIASAQTVTAT